jgi:hypothetical protein
MNEEGCSGLSHATYEIVAEDCDAKSPEVFSADVPKPAIVLHKLDLIHKYTQQPRIDVTASSI